MKSEGVYSKERACVRARVCLFCSLTGTSAESQRKVILMNRSHDCNLSLSISRRRMTSSPPFLTCAVFHMCLLWKTQRRGKTPAQPERILPKTGNKTPVSLPLVVLLEILPFYANNGPNQYGLEHVGILFLESDNARLECGSTEASFLPRVALSFLCPDDTCAREE